MARRPAGPQHVPEPAGERTRAWDPRLDIVIVIALGLAAIVAATAVYLNEKEEHKATLDFHEATHRLLDATAAGLRTPEGRALEATAGEKLDHGDDRQEKAARYTLIEVILALSLFLLVVAGVTRRQHLKLGALGAGGVIFLTALVLMATV